MGDDEVLHTGRSSFDRAALTLQQLLLVLKGSPDASPFASPRFYVEDAKQEIETPRYPEEAPEELHSRRPHTEEAQEKILTRRSGYGEVPSPPRADPAELVPQDSEDILDDAPWSKFDQDDGASIVHSRPVSANIGGDLPPAPPPQELQLDPCAEQDEVEIGWDQELSPSDAGQVGIAGAAMMETTFRPSRSSPPAAPPQLLAPRDLDETAAARARSGKECFVDLLQKLVGITQGQHSAFLPDDQMEAVRDRLSDISGRLEVFTQFLEEQKPPALEATRSLTLSDEEPLVRRSSQDGNLRRSSTLGITQEELWAKQEEVEAKAQELADKDSQIWRQQQEIRSVEQRLRKREQELQDLQDGLQAKEQELAAREEMLARHENQVPTPPLVQEAFESEELRNLKVKLDDATRAKNVMEQIHEKELEDFSEFSKAVAESSAASSLPSRLKLDTAEMLGMGQYGYVFLCQESKSNEKLVIKVQSTRWMDVAAHEWATASKLGTCENIVKTKKVILHRDADLEVQHLLEANFENGSLTGRRPKRWPSVWIALFLEYADAGSLQHLMDKQLVDVEGTGAVATQVANALSFMHKKRMTHNDVKPENILFCRQKGKEGLVAKLADLGLAQHSVDRSRDSVLHAYTIWCAGLLQRFQSCPNQDEQKSYLQQWDARGLQLTSPREKRIWQELSNVLLGLWKGTLDMQEVCTVDILRTCKVRVHEAHSEQLEHLAKNEIKRRSILDFADAKTRLSVLHGKSLADIEEEPSLEPEWRPRASLLNISIQKMEQELQNSADEESEDEDED
mmetsp:Transcript_37463/g.67744  ORF Transcript_37463/g.67744 Transcript_37463/m.67744 type:complete len:795 (-) Transcript_37463:86-2470(-)